MTFGSALRTIAGLLLVIAIPLTILIPLLATGSGTSGALPVMAAIVDNDTSQTHQGRQLSLGRDLVRRLTDETTDVQWVQVTAADARRGVQSGRYAAMATVPQNFTASTLAAAVGGQVEPQVSIITSPMSPAVQPLVSYSVARATSQTLGSVVANTTLDKVFLTFTDGNVAFKNAASEAAALAGKVGALDAQSTQAQDQSGGLSETLGTVAQQAKQVGQGPGLPTVSGTQAQIAAADQQIGDTSALSADAQRAIVQAAAQAQTTRAAGAQSASTIEELDKLAQQLDQQASQQQAGVDGYTTSVAAAAQRQRGMDASLRGIQTQLAGFSNQLTAITAAAKPKTTVPASLKTADAAADDPLPAALAAMRALVNQLETDGSTATAVTLATQLKSLADTNDGGLDGLEARLVELRRLYNNSGQGNEDKLPVKCPYAGSPGNGDPGNGGPGNGGPWNDCRAWRAGVVTGLGLALDELEQTQINDKTNELRQLAATNLTNVTAINDGRDELLVAARKAVVALQAAIDAGTPPAEVIKKVTEIASEAKTLSTTAQTLTTTASEQSAALDELDQDGPAVKQLASATQTMNTTMAKQDQQMAALVATVTDLSTKLDGLSAVVATANQQTAHLQTTGTGLRATLAQLRANQQDLETDLSTAQKTIDAQDDRLTRLSSSAADAQAAGKVLATQLEALKAQSNTVTLEAAGHAATLQKNSEWPALDPVSKQRITALLTDPPRPDIDTTDDLGWKALAATMAIWVGALGGSAVAMRLTKLSPGAIAKPGAKCWWRAPLASALTAVLVFGAVSLWLVPRSEGSAGALVAVIAVGSLAAAATAHALRLTLGPVGVWVGLTLLGLTVLAFTPASPGWLDSIRDWSVTSPLVDALRITITGGDGAGPKVASLLAWTVVALGVAVLASLRFRPVPELTKD